MISKQGVILAYTLIVGVYSVVVGVVAVVFGYSNDLVWVSIITAYASAAPGHVALSFSKTGATISTAGTETKA